MSTWRAIVDPEDIDISDDGETIEILYETDECGNNYIEIPLDIIFEKLSRRLKEA